MNVFCIFGKSRIKSEKESYVLFAFFVVKIVFVTLCFWSTSHVNIQD